MRIGLYARALLNRVVFGRKQAPTNTESIIIPSMEGGIPDGVNYNLPALLPGYLREHLEHAGVLDQYLQEAALPTSLNFQFDAPAVRDAQFIGVFDDPLMEWDEGTRMYVLANTHAAYARNPLAKRCVHYISAFTVGAGFNLHCQNKEVERVLEEFIDDPDNAFREYERQAIRDLVVDGELFLRFFKGKKNGLTQVVAVPMRPWEIKEIVTEIGFFKRVKHYHYQPYGRHNVTDPSAIEPTNAEDIPGNEIIHVAINKHAYELRGRSELYAALPMLKAHKDWLEDRARQNKYRGTLLWWVRIKNALPGVIAAKIAQYSKPFRPGSIAVTTDNEEFQALTNPVGASDAGEDGRQLKIMAQNGIGGLPEYFTGDGQNANLATTKSQQLPVLTTFREMQTIYIEQVLIPTFKRVLQAKIDAKELPPMVDVEDADGDPVEVPAEDALDDASGYHPEPEAEVGGKPKTPLAAAIQEAEELTLKIAKKSSDPADGEDAPADGAPMPKLPPPKPIAPPKMVKAPQIDTLHAFTVDYEPLDQDAPKDLADALAIAEDHEWISAREAATRFGADYTIQQKQIKIERAQKASEASMGMRPQMPGTTPPGLGQEEQDDGSNPFSK